MDDGAYATAHRRLRPGRARYGDAPLTFDATLARRRTRPTARLLREPAWALACRRSCSGGDRARPANRPRAPRTCPWTVASVGEAVDPRPRRCAQRRGSTGGFGGRGRAGRWRGTRWWSRPGPVRDRRQTPIDRCRRAFVVHRARCVRPLVAAASHSAIASASGRIGRRAAGPRPRARGRTTRRRASAPCFQPIASNWPIRSNPSARCSQVEAGFGCVIPATTRWKPWRRRTSSTAVIAVRPRPRPCERTVDVHRRLDGPVVGRPVAVARPVGVARTIPSTSTTTHGVRAIVCAMRAAISSAVGGVELERDRRVGDDTAP